MWGAGRGGARRENAISPHRTDIGTHRHHKRTQRNPGQRAAAARSPNRTRSQRKRPQNPAYSPTRLPPTFLTSKNTPSGKIKYLAGENLGRLKA